MLAAVLVEFLLYGPLLLVGGRALIRPAKVEEGKKKWPRVGLMVPVAGVTPATANALESLLAQDYPDYEVMFCLRDERDPAVEVVRAAVKRSDCAHMVFAGKAKTCSQKNHNLLAGLRAMAVAPEVWAFCDSTRWAPPGFLAALVAPIAKGEARVTSGYHHVLFEGQAVLGPARSITVLILYLTKAISALNQPWGGATAIHRDLFEQMAVERLWETTVVDDVTLAARLEKAGVRTALADGACLLTNVTEGSLSGYLQWLDRQWLYLKFVFPAQWMAAGLNQHVLALLSLLAAGAVVGFLLGWSSWVVGAAGLGFLAGTEIFGAVLWRLHPRPGPCLQWLGAIWVGIFLSSWSHLRTVFARTLEWKGVRYSVGRGGVVHEILRAEE